MKKSTSLSYRFSVSPVFLIYICLLCTGVVGYSQVLSKSNGNTTSQPVGKKGAGYKTNWTSNPFDHQVFIENRGQFEGLQNGDKILYGAKVGDMYMFITPHGLVYKYTELPEAKISPDKKNYTLIDPDEVDPNKKPIQHYLTATWEGSGSNITVIAGEEQTYYYTYPASDNKGTIKATIFKTITCRNVYPGIDVKYTFPEGKDGFKYTLIVHPGADLSLVKLKYDGAKKMNIDKDGNIEIKSGWGQFVDHAPVSYYDKNSTTLVSAYQLNNMIESFSVKNADKTKTLVIDPWITNWTAVYTGTSGYTGAYDLDYDYAGNVYIYGGYNPFQLAKYNSAGIQLWTYNTSNFNFPYFGAFCVDKASGVSFCFEGFGGGGSAYTDKISTTGVLLNTLTVNTLDEQWRAAYDLCSHTIAIAGGGVSSSLQAATLDTNNSFYTSANVLGLPPNSGYHDLCLVASDPIVDTTYMASTWTFANQALFNNVLMRLPMPTLTPTGLLTRDGFNFQECFSPAYVATGHGNTNGMNGMAVSPNWIYLYDGDTLRQEDKATGAIHSSISVSGTYFTWGGISVDLCDNIYLGDANSVNLYDVSLAPNGVIGPFPGNVYDVVLGNGVLASHDSTLYVCGKGFVSSIHIDPPSPPIIKKTHRFVCSCSCTATGLLTFCGNIDTSNNASYLWSNGQTTHTATGLCPGNTYTLTVKLGCAQQYQDTFVMPLTDTFHMVKSFINPTCGLCNGSATITASGGGSPYTYLWTPGGQTTQTATGLCIGTYTITVKDSCGDITTAAVTLSTNGLLVTPNITANEKCNGNCIGSVTAKIAVGSPPYTYSWTPSGQTTATATGLCAGTYTITVKDLNGCSGTATATITQPTVLSATTTTIDALCNGGTGSATASPSGGTSPYTYLWNPSAQTNAVANGLSARTYTVTVTDSNGCTATATATITQPTAVTASIGAPSNVLCNGGAGSATATASGGTPNYTYAWSPIGGTNAMGTGLTAGSYTVTVNDANSCTGTASVTITQPAVLSATASFTHASCNLPNGTATVNVTGGTGPFAYLWNPSGETTVTATKLSIGTYTVTVTDKNSCTTSASVTVTEPSAVTAVITATKNVSCNNGGDGAVTVKAGGGTAPYTYLWTPSNNTTASPTGFFALTYTVTVTDANGCTVSTSTTLTQPPVLDVSISEPVLICKDSTGNIYGNATGGTAPYKYTWSGGVTSTTATATITPIATRNYSVVVTDNNGCTATAAIVLKYGPDLFAEIKGKNSVCKGDSTTLCAYASGGEGTATYLWQPSNNTDNCINVVPGIASAYTVQVVDGCGATTTAGTTVYTSPSPVIGLSADIYEGCAPLCIQFRNTTSISQGGIRQYVWTFGNKDTSQAINPIYCYAAGGSYSISLTAISDSGCSATFTKGSLITVFKRPDASFTYSPQPVTILTPTIQFTDESTDKSGIAYHLWSFGDGSDSVSTLANPSHTYHDTGNYCANLVVMNDHGCTDTATNCFVIGPAFRLYIPSAFTPNGDGIDDVFQPKGQYISNFEMYIFDRWGLQLYHTTDINNGWDGTVNGVGSICQEDTYIYKITVTDTQDTQHSYIGNINLIK